MKRILAKRFAMLVCIRIASLLSWEKLDRQPARLSTSARAVQAAISIDWIKYLTPNIRSDFSKSQAYLGEKGYPFNNSSTVR